jgi:DNA-binding MarR family transcriptional regulator
MTPKKLALARGTGRAVSWLARQVEIVLAERDLTLAQYRLLALLDERPEMASVLAEKLTVSRPAVTTVVDGLAARGLVDRSHDTGDRRRVNHVLTPAGKAVLREADDAVEAGLQGVLDQLDATGARDIAAGLGTLGETLSERIAAWQPSTDQA